MVNNTTAKTYTGRTVLYTDVKVVDGTNIVDVLNSVRGDYEKNKSEIDYLYRYYRGEQPILRRKKKVRPEINNKVVENHAHEIVSFKVGYDFGEPVQYVRRATETGRDTLNQDNAEIVDKDMAACITALNEYMYEQDKAAKDKDLAEWFFIGGTAYRMVLATDDTYDGDSPFEIDIPDPRYTGVIYNSGFGKRPVMAFQEFKDDQDESYFCCYTPAAYYEIRADVVTLSEPHAYGAIPIIEYTANNSRIGAFELVLGLLDEINNVESNRIDGIEQFVQSFMKFINANIDAKQFEEMRELGALLIKSDPGMQADVQIISSELDQQQTQTVIDHLYQMVLIIVGMPDRNGAHRTTGDTGQAVQLRDGWTTAETKAKETEGTFSKSENRFLRIVLRIIEHSRGMSMSLSDIDIKFARNKTENILTKTQALMNMCDVGINPQIAIANCNIFGDPEQVYIDSKPYLDRRWSRVDDKYRNDPEKVKYLAQAFAELASTDKIDLRDAYSATAELFEDPEAAFNRGTAYYDKQIKDGLDDLDNDFKISTDESVNEAKKISTEGEH